MSFFGGLLGPPQSGLGQLQQRNQALAAQQAAFLGQQNTQMAATHGGLTSSNNWVRVYNASTSTTTATTGSIYFTSGTGTLSVVSDDDGGWVPLNSDNTLRIPDGQARKIRMPDGTIIDVKADGSFEIEDKDAKVIYRANRMRDFNPFINVSDRLEEFIEFCGQQGVKQGEMMELPINLFVGWLVLQAAKADKEPEPDIKLLPDLRKRVSPQCPSCGRFTSQFMRTKKIEFCGPPCFTRHYERETIPILLAAE